ncbi:hypothetical protein XENORESO_006448 [Xenotaenia resolanae]|uniref:Uncharacterized protein n=1 Tax=Xenotaenia resolanae TaxID=208358 RepID=A0ABV0VPA9_9TELE
MSRHMQRLSCCCCCCLDADRRSPSTIFQLSSHKFKPSRVEPSQLPRTEVSPNWLSFPAPPRTETATLPGKTRRQEATPAGEDGGLSLSLSAETLLKLFADALPSAEG